MMDTQEPMTKQDAESPGEFWDEEQSVVKDMKEKEFQEDTEPTASSSGCCCGIRCTWKIWLGGFVGFLVVLFIVAVVASVWGRSQYKAHVTSIPWEENSQAQAMADQDVLVIGAGAAGLFAGYTLEYLGVPYKILEANDNFGGRVKELPAGDFVDVPLDLGAEWIHVEPRVMKDMLLFADQRLKNVTMPETIEYRPKTFSSFKRDKLRQWRWPNLFYAETKFKNSTWWGYLDQYIVPRVESKLQLNTVVQTIDYTDPDRISVTTTDGTAYTASHVIMAVPISMLQNGEIEFIPELPSRKAKQIQKVDMAPGLKAWMEFEQDFYADITFPSPLLKGISGDKVYIDALFGKGSDHHVMALFQVGPQAEDRVEMTDDEIYESIMNELDQMFDGKATKYYKQHYIQNWSKQPYIQGAYSYNWGNYEYGPLKSSVEDRIYFSGEYLADESATVHGAAISGRKAVKKLVKHYLEES